LDPSTIDSIKELFKTKKHKVAVLNTPKLVLTNMSDTSLDLINGD
jgi:hypothetical protein